MTISAVNNRSSLTAVLSALFAGLLLAGGLSSVPLVAAPSAPAFTAADPPTLMKHLRAGLNAKDVMRRQTALQDVIRLSTCQASCTVAFHSMPNRVLHIENEAGVGTAVDLHTLVPDLMNIYHNSQVEEGEQIMALSALLNIGNRMALDQLVEDSAVRSYRQSPRVRKITQHSLVSYYLALYPELERKAIDKKTFSIEDVNRAEARQIREAKKSKTNT